MDDTRNKAGANTQRRRTHDKRKTFPNSTNHTDLFHMGPFVERPLVSAKRREMGPLVERPLRGFSIGTSNPMPWRDAWRRRKQQRREAQGFLSKTHTNDLFCRLPLPPLSYRSDNANLGDSDQISLIHSCASPIKRRGVCLP